MNTISSELSMNDLNHKFFEIMQNETCVEEATNFIYDSIFEDVTVGIMFEFHHGLKTGLTDLIEGEKEEDDGYKIVNSSDCDVFGFPIMKKTPDCNCSCPNCERPVSATRFAPHLEKCMGMGRNSSRIASRRIASNSREPTSYAGLLSDDDDDADWAGSSLPSERRKRRIKNNNNRKPNKLHKSTRCPQHTEEQRRALRNTILEPSTPENQTGLTAEEAGSPPDSSPSSSCSSSSRKRDRHRAPPKLKNKRDRNISPNGRE
ncbi:SAGA-associated factor 11 homolog isoform X3 [Achroia grisella]|uniref:SAGA-associated factor 11 homolog isoform X3 n=1 Tax=Achroia grisella TaxID=688607 RepID=UPI0027D32303|nr:SAGA-associated factor 11 homolog isoform X3 [Achroia grisella]